MSQLKLHWCYPSSISNSRLASGEFNRNKGMPNIVVTVAVSANIANMTFQNSGFLSVEENTDSVMLSVPAIKTVNSSDRTAKKTTIKANEQITITIFRALRP